VNTESDPNSILSESFSGMLYTLLEGKETLVVQTCFIPAFNYRSQIRRITMILTGSRLPNLATSNAFTISVWPFSAARCRAVFIHCSPTRPSETRRSKQQHNDIATAPSSGIELSASAPWRGRRPGRRKGKMDRPEAADTSTRRERLEEPQAEQASRSF
jgi:hypothetical protein